MIRSRVDKTFRRITVLAAFAFLVSWAMPAFPSISQTPPAAQEAETVESPQVDAQDPPTEETAPIETEIAPLAEGDSVASAPEEEPASLVAVDVVVPRDPQSYGLWTIIPAIIAILLAILTRQVIPALLIGVFTAAYMMVPCLAADDPLASFSMIVAGIRLGAERYIFGAITDSSDGFGHARIMVFTLVIGFTVGVIARNGGTAGLVRLVAGKTESRRRGALTAWFAGLVVFFDDYANTMIVGPTMQSIFDRLKLSRAKLAYIVDSTAAPVASIALIGTWVGAEVGFIKSGLDQVAEAGAPAFLINESGNVITGFGAFVNSIPFRFYPILALFLVFLVALTGRDFGPMKQAERKLLSRIDPDKPEASPESSGEPKARWWLGLIPILVLVGGTVAVLAVTGWEGSNLLAEASGGDGSTVPMWKRAAGVIASGDSYLSIFYGAFFAAVTAVVLTAVARACPMRDAIDAGMDGMARMAPALVILVLAWALSAGLGDLQLGMIAADQLKQADFSPQWLPLAVFSCAGLISFATGTSWGTMGILCPMTVTIAAGLFADLDPTVALNLFYASVGSVLAGAVFGDHCSPISDTTVLSSIASGCRHEEHVWTQLPYALVAAVAAMGLGDVMCSVFGQPWWYGLGAGAFFLFAVVLIVGRKAVPSLELADG